MKKFFFFFGVITPFISLAQAGSSDKGTNAAAFLQMGTSARGVAMGEAVTAASNDASALTWNPAALTELTSRSLTMMHAPTIDSSQLNYLAYGQRFHENNALGFGFEHFSVGDIEETDSSGKNIGALSPADMAVSLGGAHRWNGSSAGISGKFVQSKLVDTAHTWAVDAGLLSPKYWHEKFRWGAVISNIGGKLKYDRAEEKLPLVVKTGGACQWTDRWLTTLDVGFPKSNAAFVAVGTEFRMAAANDVSLALRAGYNSRTPGDLNGLSGYSAGIGVGLRRLVLDYAVVPFGDLGVTHRFSLTLRP